MGTLGNVLNNTMLLDAAADEGRIFGLDPQLLFDACVLAINIFILFIFLSYLLFNPVRNMLKKRQEKITSDREEAKSDKEAALALKAEYEAHLKSVNKEVEAILSEARKKALKNEEKILDEAKVEATRIIERAKVEAELEKNKAADQIKQEIINVSTLMAAKLVSVSVDTATQNQLFEETLGEIGESTWRS